jgi:hypothetical protein
LLASEEDYKSLELLQKKNELISKGFGQVFFFTRPDPGIPSS